ncbi:hypothetical protein PR202_gb16658 [Eleusine coracana subsp. coracana]|uniref:Clp R domain-containing protein n=1 Tax=Eleusine coracana subsp. coracana TaxID=191504 RepID=A0AAV5F0T4_ELECO|nr:hypothetical protein PR202_gb16658 [Eleusine coracana subsp. coracana]
MPTPVAAARQCLAPAAVTALDAAVASARRRAHAQTTSLHLVFSLLAPNAPPLLRDALNRVRSAAYSPRLQLKALDLCFAVSLDRLPSSSSSSKDEEEDPPVSNSLMAAIKRSQANQRRNPDTFHFYQTYYHPHPPAQSPTTAAVKVDLSHLLLAILDDPLVSRVFADAGFRGADIKLAVLRPAPPVPLLAPTRRARPPPLFLCSFAAADDADDLSAAAATCSNVVISVGDLKDLVPDDADAEVVRDGKRRVVAEVTRLLETHRGRVSVMGWSATYETYLAFLSKFPLLDKDWDLQLLPVTAVRSTPPPAAADAGALPPATTIAPPLSTPATPSSTSLMEPFVPFGGFLGDLYEANNFAANSCPQALRCQQCNDRYEQEVTTIIKGSGLRVEDNQQGGLPLLLQNGSMLGPNSGFDAVKKKWNEYCLRLHQGCQRISRDPYQLFPHYVSVPADRVGATNASKGPEEVAPQREVIKPSVVSLMAKSISSPSISNQGNDDLVLNLQMRQSKSDELLQDMGVHSQHRNSSNSDNRNDHTSPSSAGPVATDLVLGTPREYSSKSLNSAPCKHVEDVERSVNPMPSKVDDLNLKPIQPFVQPYSCSRSLTNLGQTSPGSLHSGASGGNSAFGQWQRPSPLAAQSSDMSNYKLLLDRLFKSVGRQEEALSAICGSIVQRRSVERRRGANKRNDIWFSFHGPDCIAKRRIAAALAEVMHGSSDNLICLDPSHQDWGNSNFRGKSGTDCIVEELRKKRRSVIFLDNIEKADCLVQDSLSRAIEIGKFDWQGRLVDLNDSIVVLSTRMTRDCKTASLGVEEGHAFSEEKVMAARGHQLKILVEPGTGSITGGPVGKLVVSSGHPATSIQASLYSGSVSKRKLNVPDGEEKILESLSTSKRLHRTSSVPFDLNLPVDEGEGLDADDDNSSQDNSFGSPDGSIENLLRSVDESISFKPFDFGKLCEDILKEFSSTMSNILGSNCRFEVDIGAMVQILSAAWASDSEKRPVRTWLDQVFASSLEQVRLKSTTRNISLLELVSFSSVQGVVSLVVDNVTMVANEVVHPEASEENAKASIVFGTYITSRENAVKLTYSFDEVVVWDLGEEVVDDMGADVMVDLVDPAVIPVNGRQTTTKVAPFL